ncbi:MAG TPA: Dam family site-specific DNA-(adenine-N6)-methyltransferase [Vicinamibacterales bacterium]|jgi:DNA adenine methylase|nr:Dam family site-specific DNA-(adenine-N6)-methyltransferase [Vicinamibacterales bacterium]
MPDAIPVRPILKWAGGKRQLLPRLRPYYPKTFSRYLEPFLGSGAVFLDLHNSGALEGREVRLSDINTDVIGCYRAVRDDVEAVIEELERLAARYRKCGTRAYYAVRDSRFNPERRRVHASAAAASSYSAALAAMLIFLNRTGFNGLFRVNARGEFNVPAGRQTNPRICDSENLRAWSRTLRRPGVSVEAVPYDRALADARDGDFIYLDPPYAPVSATARFTSYTAKGFGAAEQTALQRLVVDVAGRGALVLLSNSAAPEIRQLYARSVCVRGAGLRATTVAARRAINSRPSGRGSVREYLITNLSRRA